MAEVKELIGYGLLSGVFYFLCGLGISSCRWASHVNLHLDDRLTEHLLRSTAALSMEKRKRLRSYKQMRTFSIGALFFIAASCLYLPFWK